MSELTNAVTISSNFVVKEMSIGIPVTDLQKSVEWYEKNLGCKLIAPISGVADLQLTPQQIITLFIPDDEQDSCWFAGNNYQENPHYSITMLVQDIDKLFSDLIEAGVKVGDMLGQNSSCGKTFLFNDLDGNRFQAWGGYVNKG
ncbi:VOC family protein [Paenibacillus ginsengarvi]|nr:VOC family protein [Paenibacillus ginsengarvi]